MSACDLIADELAALRAEIGNLNGKFALKTEINRLDQKDRQIEQQISNLSNLFISKSERPHIVTESVQVAEKQITPKIFNFVNQEVGEVKNEINLLEIALQTLVITIKTIEAFVKGLLDDIEGWKRLLTLPSRVDNLEAGYDKLLGRLTGLRTLIDRVSVVANEALNIGQRALDIAYLSKNLTEKLAIPKADNALTVARQAKQLAEKAINDIDFLKNSVERALSGLTTRLTQLIYQVKNELEERIKGLNARIETVNRRLDIAEKTIYYGLKALALGIEVVKSQLADLANGVYELWRDANNNSGNALRKAGIAEKKADEALKKVAIPGLPGRDGKPGKDGKNGKDGITTIVTIPGLPGRDGKPGKDGITRIITITRPGTPGKDGKDGKDAIMSPEIINKLRSIYNLVGSRQPLNFQQTVLAVKTGVCEEAQPGKCLDLAISRHRPDSLETITVTVPIGSCTLVNDVYQYVQSETDIQCFSHEELATLIEFQKLNEINKNLCESRNDIGKEAVASVPLNYQIKPEWQRAQMVLHFAAKREDGTFDSAKYVINVPHWALNEGVNVSIPSYEKGKFECIYTLSDNSKITINAKDENECLKVINALKPCIKPEMLENAILRPCGLISSDIKVQMVYPKYGNFFSKGAKNMRPDWRIKLDGNATT